jgi:multidrug efflux pump subunit AcrA (membrane-fusion protein)
VNSPSPGSTETIAQHDQSAARAVHSIAERVATCARGAGNQTEFLQSVAGELAAAFPIGVVALELGDGSGPLMLVTDAALGQQVDRGSIRGLLATAAFSPLACEVRLVGEHEDSPQTTRGLCIEVRETPRRAAVLLIYATSTAPSAIEQIHDLKQLSLYADAMRHSILDLPPASRDDQSLSGKQDKQHELAEISPALRNRRSLQMFHQDLDIDATAYRIANESRHLLRCDRVTVLLPQGNGYRVRAISGVAVIDARSNSVRSIEELTFYASAMSRPLMFPADDSLPPQVQTPLDTYLDESGVKAAIMLPLHDAATTDQEDTAGEPINPFESTGDIIAVMMLEYFSGEAPTAIGPGINLVATEAVLALRNSQEHKKIFGLRFWKFLGSAFQNLRSPLVMTAVLAVCCLLIASALIKIEHYVMATGSAQPQQQRQVFANVDGIVKSIFVSDGQPIKAGEPILQLENAELDNQAEALSGEILTTVQRLASIQAVRLSSDNDSSQSGRLVLEERQLQSELANLRAQQRLIEKQQGELLITSPIDGTIVAWQLDRRLSDRPVARGNLLVSVVNHAGPWMLRLTVPDQDAGPVLEAFEQQESLPVRFAVATVPNASFAATLDSVATATRLDESGQYVIDVTANVAEPDQEVGVQTDDSLLPFAREDVRVGADVTAKVGCGQRTILRSWFSDVFDFVDRNVLFYFR